MTFSGEASDRSGVGTKIKVTTLAGVVATAIACLAAYLVTFEYLARTQPGTERGAKYYANSIDLAVTRLSHLPRVIAADPHLIPALVFEDPRQLQEVADYLSWVASITGARGIEVMDINGKVIASAKVPGERETTGEMRTFRRDVQGAINGRIGTYFTASPEDGAFTYHLSAPVKQNDGLFFGVVSVRVALDDVGRAWEDTGELVLLTNRQGVVLAASDRRFLHGLLQPLKAYERRQLELGRQFGDQPLRVLDWVERSPNRVELDGETYVWNKAQASSEPWTIHLLTDIRGIQASSILAGGGVLILALVSGLAMVLFQSAQLREALRQSNEDRRQLRETQALLARKSRMEALGQLSASITHELGQPISAMRNYLVASEIGQQDEEVTELHQDLSKLVSRVEGIISQLKSFSQPGAHDLAPFDIETSVDASVALVRHDAEALRASITILSDEDLPQAFGDQGAFEQVLINLLKNALDAMAKSEARRLTVHSKRDGDVLCVAVSDTGTGLGGLSIGELQEPFFTTKASGKGMGLGLSISAQIIESMEGSLTAQDGTEKGAVFEVRMPIA